MYSHTKDIPLHSFKKNMRMLHILNPIVNVK